MYNREERIRNATMRMIKESHGRLSGPSSPGSPSGYDNTLAELIAENTDALDKMAEAIARLSLSDQRAHEYNQGFLQPITYQDIGLTAALTDRLVTFPPTKWLHVTSDGKLDGITIKLNTQSEQSIDIKDFNTIPLINATRLYLTSDVVAGRTTARLTFSLVEPNKVSTSFVITDYIVTPAVNVYTSGVAPGAATVYSTMVDARTAKNLVFKVTNTVDVIITVQAIGNLTNNTATASLMGVAVPVPALTGIETLGIDLSGDDWHGYVGVQIIIPAGATAGTLVIDEVLRS